MKRTLILILSLAVLSAWGQTKDTLKVNRYADSVNMYTDVILFYGQHFDYLAAKTGSQLTILNLLEDAHKKVDYYKYKYDLLNVKSKLYQDSLATENDRKYLETKYHIKLK